jgi:two-component system, sensor histidine kinase YesM
MMHLLRKLSINLIHIFNKLNYRKKLLISFIIAIMIPFIIMSVNTYLVTFKLMEEQVEDSFVQTMKQIEINIDKQISQVAKASNLIYSDANLRKILTSTKNKVFYDELLDYWYLEKYLLSLEDNFNLYRIRMFFASNAMYTREGHHYFPLEELNHVQNMDEIDLYGQKAFFWKATYKQSYKYRPSQNVISNVNVMKNVSGSKVLAVTFIDILEEDLYKSIEDVADKDGISTVVINAEGRIISAKDKSTLGQYYDSSRLDKILKNDLGKIKEMNELTLWRRINTNGYILVSIIPLDILRAKTMTIAKTTILLMIFILIFAIFISLGLSNGLSKRLNYLLDAMKKNKNQDDDEILQEVKLPAEMSHDDEIGQVVVSYNKMVKRVRRLIDEVYQVRYHESEARFHLLQAQINPHFLYNILESIKSFVFIENLEMANELLIMLARFYRISLSKGRDMITIAEELEMTKLYVNMQRICYGDKLELLLNVDEKIMQCLIVKFTLQPLVENAILHGFEYEGERNTITIQGRQEGDKIIMQVKDNGIGINENELERIRSEMISNTGKERKSFGLHNVNARLQLYHLKNYGVNITSRPGEGTLIEILLPYVI